MTPSGDGRPRTVGSILAAGPPGSGKTTFARALARKTGFVLLDLDDVTGPLTAAALHLLGLGDDALGDRQPGGALRDARYGCLLATAAENLTLGHGVVLAAPFTRERADPAAWGAVSQRLAEASGGAVSLCYLDCPPPVLVERMARRGAARDRAKLADRSDLVALGLSGRPAVPHVLIDATLPVEAQVEHALAGLARENGPTCATADDGGVLAC